MFRLSSPITRLFLAAALIFSSNSVLAENTVAETDTSFKLKPVPELQDEASDRFPGDPAEHKVVYMWNKADASYQLSILNSIQAMIRRYGDNVDIAVVVIGPGLHILAKQPKRDIDALSYDRVASFAQDYNVRWIACGNTMNSLNWNDKDMRPFAEYAQVGAAALMELQEEGYQAIYW